MAQEGARGHAPVHYLPGAEDERKARWEEAVQVWLTNRLSQKTHNAYQAALHSFQTYLDDKPLWEVTRANIIGWRDALIAEEKADNTVKSYIAAVSSLYRFALNETPALMDYNPCYAIERPKVDDFANTRWITLEEAKKILAAIDRTTVAGRRDFCLCILMLTAALRANEAVSVKRGDLVPRPGGGMELRYRPKGGVSQTRELPTVAIEAIEAHLKDRGNLDDTSPVFVAYDRLARLRPERKLTTEALRNMLARYSLIALGRAVNPHSMRHGAATLLHQLTNSVEDVQHLLGHESLQTTQRYIHRTTDNRGELGNKLAEAYLGPTLSG